MNGSTYITEDARRLLNSANARIHRLKLWIVALSVMSATLIASMAAMIAFPQGADMRAIYIVKRSADNAASEAQMARIVAEAARGEATKAFMACTTVGKEMRADGVPEPIAPTSEKDQSRIPVESEAVIEKTGKSRRKNRRKQR